MILPVVLKLLKAVQIDYLEQRKPEFFEQHQSREVFATVVCLFYECNNKL